MLIKKKTALQWFIIATLLLGLFFRFFNLDRKVYWYDEAFTSLRVSGFTRSEYIQQSFNGQLLSVEDIQKYQHINPEKNIFDTVQSLAEDVHPPLYFVLTRLWVQLFGDSIATIRALAAFASVAVFPSLYWLCRELFESPPVAWVALALVAVSPFHLLYAQEARMYSLMTVAIVLSSAALLYSLRQKTKISWLVYTASLIIGLYSHLYFVVVVFGQALYLLLVERLRLTRTALVHFLAICIAFIVFSPWIFVVFKNLENIKEITAGAQTKTSLLTLLKAWIRNLSQIFVDIGTSEYFAPIVFILVVYSLYFLFARAPRKAWLFVGLTIGTTAVFLMLPDIISGGQGSLRSRYFIPCYLGIQIAVAYLLATQLQSRNVGKQKLGAIALVLTLTGGIVSCGVSSQATSWWNKSFSHYNLPRAAIINQAANPLVASSTHSLNALSLLSLSHYLDPDVNLLLLSSDRVPNLTKEFDRFSDVFIYNLSPTVKQQLERDYTFQPVEKSRKLVRLNR